MESPEIDNPKETNKRIQSVQSTVLSTVPDCGSNGYLTLQ